MAGAPGGFREAPAVGGRAGRGTPTTTRVTDQATSSSVARRERPDSGPVPAGAPSCRRGAPSARSGPVRDPGTGCPFRVPGDLGSPPERIRSAGRRRRGRLRLPGGSARCPEAVGGGRGENRRASQSVGGRTCTVGGKPEAAGVGLQVGGSGTDPSVAVTRGRGRPVSAGSGCAEDGVQRLAAVVALAAVPRLFRSSGERAPYGARRPGVPRRCGSASHRAGHRVTASPGRPGRRRRPPVHGRPAVGPGAFRRSTRSYAEDGHCSAGDRRQSPRAGRRRRTAGRKRHGGGRRRGLDRGDAGQFAQHHGWVDRALHRGGGGTAPGQVLPARTGAPHGGPAGEGADPSRHLDRRDCGGRGGRARAPREALAARSRTPHGGPADQAGEPRNRSPRRLRQRAGSRRRGGSWTGHRRRPDRPEGHRADGGEARAGGAVCRRTSRLRTALRSDAVGTVEDVDEPGDGPAARTAVGVGRHGHRSLAAHVASSSSCPQPGKVLRTRRKIASGRASSTIPDMCWKARDRTVAQHFPIGR